MVLLVFHFFRKESLRDVRKRARWTRFPDLHAEVDLPVVLRALEDDAIATAAGTRRAAAAAAQEP